MAENEDQTGSARIEAGSVVRLASGGPRITVERVSASATGDRGIHCVWFVGDQQRRDVFAEKALVLVPPEATAGGKKR